MRESIVVRSHSVLTNLIATCFLVGYIPIAPGTFGALTAVVLSISILSTGGKALLSIVTFIVFLVGMQVSRSYCRYTLIRDPPCIVIDEVVGQWLAILLIPNNFTVLIMSIGLFRLLDIVKPWPVRWIEKTLHNGWDIMVDDIMVAVYTGLLIHITYSGV